MKKREKNEKNCLIYLKTSSSTEMSFEMKNPEYNSENPAYKSVMNNWCHIFVFQRMKMKSIICLTEELILSILCCVHKKQFCPDSYLLLM